MRLSFFIWDKRCYMYFFSHGKLYKLFTMRCVSFHFLPVRFRFKFICFNVCASIAFECIQMSIQRVWNDVQFIFSIVSNIQTTGSISILLWNYIWFFDKRTHVICLPNDLNNYWKCHIIFVSTFVRHNKLQCRLSVHVSLEFTIPRIFKSRTILVKMYFKSCISGSTITFIGIIDICIDIFYWKPLQANHDKHSSAIKVDLLAV